MIKVLRLILRVLGLGLRIAFAVPLAYLRFLFGGREKVLYTHIPLLHHVDNDALYSTLVQQNYPTDVPSVRMFGGGLYSTRAGRVIIESSGSGGSTEITRSQDTRSLAVGNGIGLTNIGLLLVKTRRLRFYPLLGVGGGGTNLVPMTRDPNNPSVVTVEQGTATDLGGGMMLHAGLGLELKLGGKLGMIVGLRTGLVVPVNGPTGAQTYLTATSGAGWFPDDEAPATGAG